MGGAELPRGGQKATGPQTVSPTVGLPHRAWVLGCSGYENPGALEDFSAVLCAENDRRTVSVPLPTTVLGGLGQVACPLWVTGPHYESSMFLGSFLHELPLSQVNQKPVQAGWWSVGSLFGGLVVSQGARGFRNKPGRVCALWGSCPPT